MDEFMFSRPHYNLGMYNLFIFHPLIQIIFSIFNFIASKIAIDLSNKDKLFLHDPL